MKKLPKLLNTPARIAVAVGAIILVGEFLIMLLFESLRDTLLSDMALEMMAIEFIDPILLILLVSPVLYFLVFRPMREQHAELEVAHSRIAQAHREWMAALDVVDDPIFLHDKEFRILRCNQAYQQRAGMPFEQIIGQRYYEIFPKTDTPLPCCLKAMEKAEEEEEEEEEVTVGDTSYRSRSFSVHDEQGVHLYSVHILEDITERKRDTKRLQKSERQYRTIIETALDGYWLVDLQEDRLLEVNDAYCLLSGYTREELLNMRVSDLEASEMPDEVAAHINGLVKQGQGRFETRHRCKNGSIVDVEVSTKLLELEDRKGVVFIRDISERKRAEKALSEKTIELNERVKELRCLYGISQLAADTGKSINTIFEEAIHLIPSGWRYPEITCARITFDKQEFMTDNFAETPWKLSAGIVVSGNAVGAVDVYYLEEKPTLDEGPFMKEERKLLDELATKFASMLESNQGKANLAEQIDELRRWHDVTLGREMRILELKSEVNELLGQTGQPPHYPSATADDAQEK